MPPQITNPTLDRALFVGWDGLGGSFTLDTVKLGLVCRLLGGGGIGTGGHGEGLLNVRWDVELGEARVGEFLLAIDLHEERGEKVGVSESER